MVEVLGSATPGTILDGLRVVSRDRQVRLVVALLGLRSVVVGALDGLDALVSTDVLVAGIPGARRLDVPGAAHLPSMECPGVFNHAVLAFIDDVDEPR